MKLQDLRDLFWDIAESLPAIIYYVGFFIMGLVVGSW